MGRKRVELDESRYSGRLAAEIRRRREKAGLDQAALAERLEVSAALVYQWESGRRVPVIDTLPAIAKALGCTIRTLLPAE